jgi:hypothetical protein
MEFRADSPIRLMIFYRLVELSAVILVAECVDNRSLNPLRNMFFFQL